MIQRLLKGQGTVGVVLVRAAVVGLLAVWLSVAAPGAVQVAHAAPLEDCDGDGFDDATGVPVPWPGYDETHGDTPAGPGTAEWWINQNQGSGGSGTGSGSGSGGSGSGSGNTGSGGSTSGGSQTGSGGSGSGGSKSGSGSGSSTSGSQSGGGTEGGTQAGSNASGTGAVTGASAATTTAVGSQVATVSAAATAALGASLSAADTTSAESSGTTGAAGGSVSQRRGSLWDALAAGFSGNREERLAGLSLLGALALAGGLSLGVTAVRDARGRRVASSAR